MKASLLITTYNWKEALGACLDSVARQTVLPGEVLIADDGSRDDTKCLIEEYARNCPFKVLHIWQEDEGFRAAKIRNKAIAKASFDYILMVDGDMVLFPSFIQDHLDAAQSGCFAQGTRIIAGQEASAKVVANKIHRLNPFAADIRNRKNAVRSPLLSKMASGQCKSIAGIRTCNFAAWRKDILSVNGFNEAFEGWGREDSEFAVRLINSGVLRKNLKFAANAIHLYHRENSRGNFDKNDSILASAIASKMTRCENGIDQYL